LLRFTFVLVFVRYVDLRLRLRYVTFALLRLRLRCVHVTFALRLRLTFDCCSFVTFVVVTFTLLLLFVYVVVVVVVCCCCCYVVVVICLRCCCCCYVYVVVDCCCCCCCCCCYVVVVVTFPLLLILRSTFYHVYVTFTTLRWFVVRLFTFTFVHVWLYHLRITHGLLSHDSLHGCIVPFTFGCYSVTVGCLPQLHCWICCYLLSFTFVVTFLRFGFRIYLYVLRFVRLHTFIRCCCFVVVVVTFLISRLLRCVVAFTGSLFTVVGCHLVLVLVFVVDLLLRCRLRYVLPFVWVTLLFVTFV